MLTHIAGITIGVHDLDAAMATYAQLGFSVSDRHRDPTTGTVSSTVRHATQKLELVAITARDRYQEAVGRGTAERVGLDTRIDAGGGVYSVTIGSDNLSADLAALERRGVELSVSTPHQRVQRQGSTTPPTTARLVSDDVTSQLRITQNEHPLAPRLREAHPNRTYEIDRVYVVGSDLASLTAQHARVFLDRRPEFAAGFVIRAEMAVFPFGSSQFVVLQPSGPGPAADALASRAPGTFQVIYKTDDLERTAELLTTRGVPIAAGGRRSDGQAAIVVGGNFAHGCNIGFVGPMGADWRLQRPGDRT